MQAFNALDKAITEPEQMPENTSDFIRKIRSMFENDEVTAVKLGQLSPSQKLIAEMEIKRLKKKGA